MIKVNGYREIYNPSFGLRYTETLLLYECMCEEHCPTFKETQGIKKRLHHEGKYYIIHSTDVFKFPGLLFTSNS